ncbi:phosphatase PAP2 family protein [Maribacter sp. 2304DJ31-5]|uniref:phosphatase PAP2 family protein n=1 Tax=Maribacter sp. 2304DJ31-5 TaxID=3386273 RepID=UPI0039BD2E77
MLETLLELDKELFLYLNGLGNASWDNFWQFVTHSKLTSIPLYLLLLILSYKQLGLKNTVLLVVAVVLLITVSDQLSNFFKYGVARLRPCHDPDVSPFMRLVKSYCGGKYGYFSAHASNSFAIAAFFGIVLRSRFKNFGIFLFIWAAFIAYSRVYIGVHFPLDIITGAVIGSLFGWVFAKLFIFASRKFLL